MADAPAPAPAAAPSPAPALEPTLDDMARIMMTGDADAPAPDAAPTAPVDAPAPADAPVEPPKDGDKPPEEPKAADAKAETPESLRKGFAALARDRKKIQEREARAAAAVESAGVFKQKAEAYDVVARRLQEDPAGLLREIGGDKLVTKFLDGVIASEKSPAEREVEKMRAELEADRQRVAEQQQAATIERWKTGISDEVARSDKYDLINALGMHEAVIEAITQYHIQHRAVLPVDIAANSVEQALETALAKSKKFGQRGAANPPASTSPGRKNGAVTTLSGVASGDVPPSRTDLPADDDQRFDAVLKQMAADGQL